MMVLNPEGFQMMMAQREQAAMLKQYQSLTRQQQAMYKNFQQYQKQMQKQNARTAARTPTLKATLRPRLPSPA